MGERVTEVARGPTAHLYRRAGFGALADELDRAVDAGYQATAARLLQVDAPDHGGDAVAVPTFSPPAALPPDPGQRAAAQKLRAQERNRLRLWWVQRMVASTNPLREKLTLFWHGHFATALTKVDDPGLMLTQNQLFRTMGGGDFEALTQAVAKDPAMVIWLDTKTNRKGHPNENFARELMELFTLGVGNYGEGDVKEAARAFTGWALDPVTKQFTVRPNQHDDGAKTVLGHRGPFGGEDVVRILCRHPASARFVVAKVWSHFAYPVSTDDPVVSQLAPDYATDRDIARLLRNVFLHPQFVSPQARTGLVKQPIEYVAGALRALGLKADKPYVLDALGGLGQVPFDPPSVGGWPQNNYWLSTASALARLRFATTAAGQADLSDITAVPASARAQAVARKLSVEGWGESTSAALQQVVADPHALVTIALTSPEYVLA